MRGEEVPGWQLLNQHLPHHGHEAALWDLMLEVLLRLAHRQALVPAAVHV